MNDVRLRKLVSSWFDGAIEAADLKELEETLSEDSRARRIYLEMMSINAELCNSAVAREHIESLVNDGIGVDFHSSREDSGGERKASFPLRRTHLWAIAAVLLIGTGIVFWQGAEFGSDGGGMRADGNPAQETADLSVLADLSHESPNCQWFLEHPQRSRPDSFRGGDIIRVSSGKLGLRYTNGTNVVLYSPASYQLNSEMSARLWFGRLTATVTDAGKGFSVLTPRAKVIDLGTEFGVDVNDDGSTDVVVRKGEVDVDYLSDDQTVSTTQRLRMGEAVRLDATGTASRIVSINNRAYYRGDGEGAPAEPVIAEVRDNIERMSSLNYCEIVNGGFGEDAKAFVDREGHEWNGVDATGMPAYLVGGDYVKTFNNDRIAREIEITVVLQKPARLFVLLDKRIPTPAWLERDFKDTGDEIGMDIGPFFSKTKDIWCQYTTEVGPGNSIENYFAVWVRDVNAAGPVRLGAPGALDTDSNMYGVVAVPMEIDRSSL